MAQTIPTAHMPKRVSRSKFKNFWANPNYVFENESVTGTFEWADVQFFMMDDFWWKAPTEIQSKEDKGDYFGQRQLDWLIDALSFSKAPFKIVVVGGQVINQARVFENMSTFDKEREKLIKAITDRKIQGVLFISGDRHHSVIHKLDRPGSYPLHDITVSPLTSGPSKPIKEETTGTMIESTLYTERNFGFATVSGPRRDRVLKLGVYSTKGELQWEREFKASELR
jgi:alkaline phosphatase D